MIKRLILLFVLIPSIGIAQPIIDSSNAAQKIGTKIIGYNFNYEVPAFPASGSNLWDFSSLPKDAIDSMTIEVVDIATVPFSDSFPEANYSTKTTQSMLGMSIELYTYMSLTKDSFSNLGYFLAADVDSGLKIPLENPQVTFRFPLELNDIQSDYFVAEDLGVSDSVQSEYVGWGAIKTPYATYPNVILLKSAGYDFMSETWNKPVYRWVSAVTLFDVAQIDYEDKMGMWFVYDEAPFANSGISEKGLVEKFNFNIAPNPATSNVGITFDLKQNSDVVLQLISVDGRIFEQVLSEKMSSGTQRVNITTNQYPAGTYFVRLLINQHPMVKRLIIK